MRILYLLNHKALTDFEVPILIKKGHEAYMSKNFNHLRPSENSINHATSRFYDNFLSIHPTTLKILDKIDFYSSSYTLSNNELDIINSHFNCIFLTTLTPRGLLEKLSKNFHGQIYFRFFGLDGTNSYRDILLSTYPGLDFSRFKFLFSYQEIIDYEFSRPVNKGFFNKHNSIYLPLGLSTSFISTYLETYHPSKHQMCFVNSRIDDGRNSYYGNIYYNFLNKFADIIPFVVLGKNNSSVDHKSHIFNNLDDKNFYGEFQKSLFMHYHSKEPRHLHYHPLEAAVIGLPVLFYSESLLSSIFPKSPGICFSETEMLNKCKLILSKTHQGNGFMNLVISYQNRNIDKLFIEKNMSIFDNFINHG